MNNKFLIMVVVLLVVGAGLFLIKNPSVEGNAVVGSGTGEIQEITLSLKNYNYYPNTITVNVNQPVRIYLDDSVYGCYRSFVIRDFGVSEYLKSSSDYVEFTPTKTGNFRFACSMGMGTGTLIVK